MNKNIYAALTVGLIGCFGYGITELFVRGRTHITMGLLGAVAMIAIHLLSENITDIRSLLCAMLISAFFITCCEFAAGEYLNIMRKMHIWDYSSLPFNIDGQVCPRYSLAWSFLSLAGFRLDKAVRARAFSENKNGAAPLSEAPLS